MATGSISSIVLPNSSAYTLIDSGLRSVAGVLSGSGSDVIGVSENYFRPTVKIFDAAPTRTDLSVIKISAEDYDDLAASDVLLSDALYVVEGSYEDVRGQQVKNMARGTDLSDAVNLEQLTEVSARAYDTYTQSEVDQKIASAQYFKKYVVQALPSVADADERGIYLVLSQDPETQNTYDEYVVVGEGSSKAWEKIGTKSIDLSGYKTKQTAKTDPAASDSATAFIDTISQDENGVITATKKNVQSASTSLAGIVQLNNTLTSTATNQAATANAVKSLNDAKVETSVKVAGQALTADVTAATISSAIGLDQYLTAVPSDYKTYDETKQSLSSDGYATQEQLNEKSAVSVDNVKADVNMVHISLDDYNEKLVAGEILSNELYVISADYVEAYGQQIKNVADPTDLSDAVTKGYVDSNFQPSGSYLTAVPDVYKTYAATLSSLSSTYSLTSHTHSGYVPTSVKINGTQLTGDINVGTITGITMNGASKGTTGNVDLGTVLTAHQSLTGYYTKDQLTGASGVLKDYSLTSHAHSQYLTAVPSTYKTYDDTKSSLSSDGYATQAQLDTKSAMLVDSTIADVNIVHISKDDYEQLVVDGEVLSNFLYVISSDYVDAHNQQVKNVAPGTDLSDAVNVEQLNAVSANAGTITGITMNGTSKGTSGNVDLGTVLTAHQSLADYYMKSETSSATEISAALSSISSTLSGLEDILHEINTGSQS